MESYKQQTKERSREMIWEHAVYSLTIRRSNNRVLQEEHIRTLWSHVFFKSKYTRVPFADYIPDTSYLNSWCDFANNIYGFKRASELKIVYLCGPEPENDLNILLRLGVSIENIWAIEANKKAFEKAIENIRNIYPTLKIFHGSIDAFFKIYPTPFDIIYLDFTAPLFSKEQKPFQTIHTIFDNQVLSELGVLITNYSVPDKTEDNVEFLADFFIDQEYLEGTVHGAISSEGEMLTWFGDSARSHYGTGNTQTLISKIDTNFKGAYSAFCSLYPIYYANAVSPDYRIAKDPILFKKMYNDEKINQKKSSNKYFGDNILYENHPAFGFVNRLNSSKHDLSQAWSNVYGVKESGGRCSRLEAITLSAFLRSEFISNDNDIFSPTLKHSIINTYRAIEWIEDRRLFCDILFPNILAEIALFQLGLPYHPQMNNHKRFKYTAKTREMNTDIITFDRCRSFYDWIPLMEFYDATISALERQIILRSCLDIIGGKQAALTPIPIYDSGVSIVGIGEAEKLNLEYVCGFPERKDIN